MRVNISKYKLNLTIKMETKIILEYIVKYISFNLVKTFIYPERREMEYNHVNGIQGRERNTWGELNTRGNTTIIQNKYAVSLNN